MIGMKVATYIEDLESSQRHDLNEVAKLCCLSLDYTDVGTAIVRFDTEVLLETTSVRTLDGFLYGFLMAKERL